MKKTNIRRGDIFFIDFDKEQSDMLKTRTALICSHDLLNENASRIIVAPITSNLSKIFSFEYVIKNEYIQGRIMFDQVRSISKSRVLNKIYTLSLSDMNQVDMILKQILGI